MGDFYVDDQFYDHPKALHAGEDAANLYVRGLAWAHRHNTGDIPKPALASLTGKANRKQLAASLVTCDMWEDRGGFWRIHDWTVRNAKSIAKREQSQRAAKARWAQHSIRNAGADADASVPQSDRNALPTKEPRNQGTKEPLVTSPPPLTVVGAGDPAAAFVAEVVETVAQRQLAATKNRKQVGSESGWLTIARRNLTALHGADIGQAHAFGQTASEVADRLEPPPKVPVDTTRRDYAHVRPDCPEAPAGCGGSGMILAYDGSAQRCPMCNPVQARA